MTACHLPGQAPIPPLVAGGPSGPTWLCACSLVILPVATLHPGWTAPAPHGPPCFPCSSHPLPILQQWDSSPTFFLKPS